MCLKLSYAQEHHSSVKPTVPSDSAVAVKYVEAVDLFNEHDDTGEALEEAKNEFLSILTINPQHAPSLAYLGLIALDNNNTTSADSLFTLALASDSTCPEAHVGRAQMYRQQLQWQKGYDEAHLAVKLAPTSVFARWELVNELIHRVEAPVTDSVVDEAIPHLQKLLEFNFDDREAHLDLAKLYERRKQWNDAAKHYQEVLRIGQTPDDMDVWVYTVHMDAARCFEEGGDFKHAMEELKLYLDTIKEYGNEEEIKKVEENIQQLEQKNH
jgi:tetratricopeptide (TPR) repeat protein